MAHILATQLLPGLHQPPKAFDPAFTEADIALIKSMGMTVITNNQMCAHRAEVPTFFYLPHLEVRRNARGAGHSQYKCRWGNMTWLMSV